MNKTKAEEEEQRGHGSGDSDENLVKVDTNDDDDGLEPGPGTKREKGKKRKAKSDENLEKKRRKKNGNGKVSDLMASGDDVVVDSNYASIKKGRSKKKGGKQFPKASSSGTADSSMPTIKEVCSSFDLKDVDIEFTDEQSQTLTTYKLFQQHVRPILQKKNPKVPISKLMMLVAVKWREFSESNPKLQEKTREDEKFSSNQAEEIPSSATEPTKITDIDDDCLEHIFNYLGLADFLNVADASKCFAQAVKHSFTTKYRGKKVQLEGIKPHKRQSYRVDKSTIYISDLKVCLKFLRHFGHTIDTLGIDYIRMVPNHCAVVDRYVNEYCAETLDDIEIYRAKPYTMNNMTKIFSEVRWLQFRKCNLGSQLTDFNKWFPKMSSLDLAGVNTMADSKCIEKHFPHLSSVTIELKTKRERKDRIGRLNVAKMLKLNSLEHILIDGAGWDTKFLKSVSNNLTDLDSLNIYLNDNFFHPKIGTMQFKNVNRFEINFGYSNVEFPKIPFSFDHLEHLLISTESYQQSFNDNFMDFIVTQKSSLKDIFMNCKFSTDEMIQFLDKFKFVEKINFELDGNSKFESLKKRLPRDWQAFKGNENYITLRKIN